MTGSTNSGKQTYGDSRTLRPSEPLAVGLVLFALGGVLLTIGLSALTGVGCACSVAHPQVSVDYQYHPGNDTLVAVHGGGDTLEAGNVDVFVGGDRREASVVDNPNSYDGRTDDEAIHLEAGDALRVQGVDPGEEVRIVWENPEDGERTTINAYHVPEDSPGS